MKIQHHFQTTDFEVYTPNRYRHPRSLNLTLQRYAILGIDGDVLAIRAYPPIKPGTLSRAMAPIPDGVKVKIGWRYVDGTFQETSND